MSSSSSDLFHQAAARLSGRSIDLESQESIGFFGNYFNQFFDYQSQEPKETSLFDGIFSLTRQQRMYGFIFSITAGVLCIFISCLMLPYILLTAQKFAFMYTVGNLFLVFSTMFLVGPKQQLKTMFNEDRRIPSMIYLLSLMLTLVVAIKFGYMMLVMILIFVQLFSMAWYILTYIPFGMRIICGLFTALRSLF
jgi:hypothetical protein